MKHIINNIKKTTFGALLLLASSVMSSCTDWLDRDPEAIVLEEEAFKNFRNFQGFVEEIYNCIPDKEKNNYCTSWNWGDDEVFNPEGNAHMTHQVDLGNYRDLHSNTQNWLYKPGKENSSTSTNKFDHGVWQHAWYCIRKCNFGIDVLENKKTFIGTAEERNLLLGQMHFFRAWWHFELMCYFGGLPYIDEAFSGEIPNLPRLSFQECADKCAADFKTAAEYLPVDWDKTVTGDATSGKNMLRINKIMALCYLGKCYLWAGSPLMEHGAQLGGLTSGMTYRYNESYCKKAAEVLGEVIEMVENGETQYGLAQYGYEDVYNHEKLAGSESNFSEIFYTVQSSWKMPGSIEAIFRGPSNDGNGSNWNCAKIFGPKNGKLVEHDNIIHHPTGNLIDQYGMKNGQPIYFVKDGKYVLNPDSGWDPEHPYKNRDPRFYHDIVFDGFHYVLNASALSAALKPFEYCALYTGGAMRDPAVSSQTGYFIQKLIPHQCNQADGWYNYDYNFHCYLPYMRLADIYLMYAESLAATTGFKSKSSTCSITAEGAVNAIRDRCGAGKVQPNVLVSKESFIDEVRRERAVELSFEGHRWCDLQRWLLLTEAPYTTKYSHEFERLEEDKWFTVNDPADARIGNFHSEEILTRPLEAKHYWFPLPDKEVYLYPEFGQNPGW